MSRHSKPTEPAKSTLLNEEIPDEPIAGSCFFTGKDGARREFTPEEYAATPRGHIFIGIGGFKPPTGKTYKPDPLPERFDPKE